MSTPIDVHVARLSRRGVAAAVALALSLACIVFAAAASAMPMTGMVNTADAAVTLAPASASVASLPMNSMCDSVCVTNVGQMCTVAGGLTVTTLLALLLATRRDTLVGLLARSSPRARSRRQRLQTPWTVLSPISLCVFRV